MGAHIKPTSGLTKQTTLAIRFFLLSSLWALTTSFVPKLIFTRGANSFGPPRIPNNNNHNDDTRRSSFGRDGSRGSRDGRLFADLSFSGDSAATLEFDAPIESVQEWLMTPNASDLKLLGSEHATQNSEDSTAWDCRQPRIDFMGLSLQPYFVNKLERQHPASPNGPALVTVHVTDSRTEILDKSSRRNQVVAKLMEKSKFSGKSVIRAQSASGKDRCQLSLDLNLRLRVDLPRFLPLPPGFNRLGSAMVSQAGNARTGKVLEDLRESYRAWAKSQTPAKQT